MKYIMMVYKREKYEDVDYDQGQYKAYLIKRKDYNNLPPGRYEIDVMYVTIHYDQKISDLDALKILYEKWQREYENDIEICYKRNLCDRVYCCDTQK